MNQQRKQEATALQFELERQGTTLTANKMSVKQVRCSLSSGLLPLYLPGMLNREEGKEGRKEGGRDGGRQE